MTEYIFSPQVVMAEVNMSQLSNGAKYAIQSTYDTSIAQRCIINDQARVIEFLLEQITEAMASKKKSREILQSALETVHVREA
jgi:hypothetical protein